MAAIIVSASKVSNSPVGTGLCLPEASFSPRTIFSHFSAVTFSPSLSTKTGALKNENITPSSFASLISISSAGICSSLLL